MICLLLISVMALFTRPSSGNDLGNYTKVENAANIHVGTTFIQKIKTFYINDSSITCTDRYLPILFIILNEKNVHVEVGGFLTEHGNLIEEQEKIKCRIFKK